MSWLSAIQTQCQTKWQGTELLIQVCAFCRNRKYNLQVDPVGMRFHCWSCEEGGGLGKLLAKLGIEGVEFQPVQLEKKEEREGPVQLPQEAKPLYGRGESSMMKDLAVRFLLHRGLNHFDIRAYDIHYCEEGDYKGRVVFPLYEKGELVYFVARTFLGEHPPYLHADTPKSKILVVCECPRSLDILVLVEGVFDMARVHKAGFTVAPLLGKTLSDDQADRIHKRNYSMVYVMLDAGEYKATYRVVSQLTTEGVPCRVALLSEGDPGEVSPNTIRVVIEGAKKLSLAEYVSQVCG